MRKKRKYISLKPDKNIMHLVKRCEDLLPEYSRSEILDHASAIFFNDHYKKEDFDFKEIEASLRGIDFLDVEDIYVPQSFKISLEHNKYEDMINKIRESGVNSRRIVLTILRNFLSGFEDPAVDMTVTRRVEVDISDLISVISSIFSSNKNEDLKSIIRAICLSDKSDL